MPRSSASSSTCRFDWRPSRWQLAALCALAPLAAGSVMASGLPAGWRLLLAAVALLAGLTQAWREWRRPPLQLAWAHDGLWLADGQGRVRHVVRPLLREQGPLLVLSGRDAAGRHWRAAWWPDTLPRPLRRQLRLRSAVSPRSAIHLPSMAA